jgi:hypothetical protein
MRSSVEEIGRRPLSFRVCGPEVIEARIFGCFVGRVRARKEDWATALEQWARRTGSARSEFERAMEAFEADLQEKKERAA